MRSYGVLHKHLPRYLLMLCALELIRPLQAQTSEEPSYNGKPLSYWVADVVLESSQMPTPLKEEAKKAIAAIGTGAVPFLVKWIGADPSAEFGASGIIQSFRVLGPAARSAIPDLALMITNQPESVLRPSHREKHSFPLVSYAPLLALGGIGRDAVPALTNILSNVTAPGMQIGAIHAITSIERDAAAALPLLLQYLDDTNEMVKLEAVTATGVVGAHQKAAIAALENIARGTNRALQWSAVQALGKSGEDAAPALIRAFSETNSGTYYVSFSALVYAAPRALTNATVLAIAAEGLRSPDAERSFTAARVLRAAGQQAEGKQPDIEVPGGRSDAVRVEATNALRRLAPQLLTDGAAAEEK